MWLPADWTIASLCMGCAAAQPGVSRARLDRVAVGGVQRSACLT